jgi:hypothetical protein
MLIAIATSRAAAPTTKIATTAVATKTKGLRPRSIGASTTPV